VQQPPAILQVHRELKYRVDAGEATRLEQIVEANLPLRPRFHVERDTIVRGVYLDWADRSLTARSLSTPQDCQKVRYRHYEQARMVRATVEHSVFVWIEVKVRLGEVVTKERVPFQGVHVPSLLAGERPVPSDASALGALLARGPLSPVVGVQYRRVAFEDERLGLRVTIDRQITFQQPSAPGIPGPDVGVLEDCVVEAKSAAALPPWLASALAGMEAPAFSKFEAAIRTLRGRES
jgi:hypothetical protein